jgi:hypothetical protein
MLPVLTSAALTSFVSQINPSTTELLLSLIDYSAPSGPVAYALEAPLPIGLLCDLCHPPLIFRRSHFRCHVPPRPYDAREPSSERWNCGREFWSVILPKCRLPRLIWGSFTCRKYATWDRRLYFPSEGRRAEDFFRPEKSWRFQPGLNPRTWVLKGSTLPLDHRRDCNTQTKKDNQIYNNFNFFLGLRLIFWEDV